MGMGARSRRTATILAACLLLAAGCGQGAGQAGSPVTGDGTGDAAPSTGTTTDDTTDDTTAPAPSAPEDTVDGTPSDPTSALPALPADPAGADIVLVVGAEGAEQPPVTLSCDFAAGTSSGSHPQVEQACADLLAAVQSGDPFAPVAPDAMCTQQYGGDAVVRVTGAVLGPDGAPVDVDATFTLTDGCQISRFDAMGAVLAPYRGDV